MVVMKNHLYLLFSSTELLLVYRDNDYCCIWDRSGHKWHKQHNWAWIWTPISHHITTQLSKHYTRLALSAESNFHFSSEFKNRSSKNKQQTTTSCAKLVSPQISAVHFLEVKLLPALINSASPLVSRKTQRKRKNRIPFWFSPQTKQSRPLSHLRTPTKKREEQIKN